MILKTKFWLNKKVLITGCTGFTGSWLIIFLSILKSKIIGYSLKPPTSPSLFNILKLRKKIKLHNGNINNYNNLKKIIYKEKPDIIFHLAANPIVLECYNNPVETFKTNSFGVLNLLEALRDYKGNITVNIITSDKCYKNSLKEHSLFNEESALGGDDVYSASKAAAEIIVNSYGNYFRKNVKITTIRSGNIIGGGDWGKFRLITDIVLSKYKNKKLSIRNINAIRPWQHIFDVLHAYLLISQYTTSSKKFESWNVAPHNTKISVKKICSYFFKKKIPKRKSKKNSNIEKKILSLNSKKIRKILKWRTIFSYNLMMDDIKEWYSSYYQKKNVEQLSYSAATQFLKKIIKT